MTGRWVGWRAGNPASALPLRPSTPPTLNPAPSIPPSHLPKALLTTAHDQIAQECDPGHPLPGGDDGSAEAAREEAARHSLAQLLICPPLTDVIGALCNSWRISADGSRSSPWALANALLDALQRDDGRGGGEGARDAVNERIRQSALQQLAALRTEAGGGAGGSRGNDGAQQRGSKAAAGAAEERAVQVLLLMTSVRASLMKAFEDHHAEPNPQFPLLFALQLEVVRQMEAVADELLVELVVQQQQAAAASGRKGGGGGSSGNSSDKALKLQQLLHVKVRAVAVVVS